MQITLAPWSPILRWIKCAVMVGGNKVDFAPSSALRRSGSPIEKAINSKKTEEVVRNYSVSSPVARKRRTTAFFGNERQFLVISKKSFKELLISSSQKLSLVVNTLITNVIVTNFKRIGSRWT